MTHTEGNKALPASHISAQLTSNLATSAATGTVLLWQAGRLIEEGQYAAAEPAGEADPAPPVSPAPNSLIVLQRHEVQVRLPQRLTGDIMPGLPVLPHSDALDREAEAAASPAFGHVPTGGSVVSGIGHLAASVSLQDLPRLAAQIAGTLVHRADGQTEVALSPEELGHVRLSMQVDAQNPDRMVVMLTFERPETLDLFRRHADQLADALRDAGYSGAEINFGQSDGKDAQGKAGRDETALSQHSSNDPARAGGDTGALQLSRLSAIGSLDLRL